MSPLWYCLGMLLVPAVLSAGAQVRRWCFYTNWAQYRSGLARFTPEDIDAYLCTHISYAFAAIKNGGLAQFEWNDNDMYKRVNDIKIAHPDLKTLLAVGGWNMGSGPFMNIVATEATRRHFINGAITFLRYHKFDGLDISWEYPTKRGSTDIDKVRFADLLKEMRVAFDKEGRDANRTPLLIGVLVGSSSSLIDSAYDIGALKISADAVSLLTYDLYNPGITTRPAAHTSALYPGNDTVGGDCQNNVEFVANYWVKAGLPKHLINIGIAFYAHSYELDDPNHYKEGSLSSRPGRAGQYTKLQGFLAYYEVCDILRGNVRKVFLSDKGVPYLVDGNQWISYENEKSVALKAEFTIKNNFGGVMLWAFDVDDFKGHCNSRETYPLLKSVYNVIRGIHIVHKSTPSPAHICNGKTSGLHPDPNSCEGYYFCSNGGGFHGHCNTGELFDVKTNLCVAQNSAKCSN